jgi:hypothetical protein
LLLDGASDPTLPDALNALLVRQWQRPLIVLSEQQLIDEFGASRRRNDVRSWRRRCSGTTKRALHTDTGSSEI